ncbi:MAG: hypothetical protein PHP85_03070 [Gallionella sp.]|nr:hypothetical protein [Gallionella sp.]
MFAHDLFLHLATPLTLKTSFHPPPARHLRKTGFPDGDRQVQRSEVASMLNACHRKDQIKKNDSAESINAEGSPKADSGSVIFLPFSRASHPAPLAVSTFINTKTQHKTQEILERRECAAIDDAPAAAFRTIFHFKLFVFN